MTSTYRGSYRGVGRMLRADFMLAHMVERAERVKLLGEVIAPYDPKDKDGHHYRDDFEVVPQKRGGYKNDRACGRVQNVNKAAFFVEWGTKNNPRHRTMGRALHAAGGDF